MKIYQVGDVSNGTTQDTIANAIEFYSKALGFEVEPIVSKIREFVILMAPWIPVIWTKSKTPNMFLRILGAYSVAPNDPSAAWNWNNLLHRISAKPIFANATFAKQISKWRKESLTAYGLGTGPSYSLWPAIPKQNRILIVTNSAVKDRVMLAYHRPQVVVAGDALFHFSETEHARIFRADLARYLNDNPRAFFAFPSHFYPVVNSTIQVLKHQLVPLRIRRFRKGSLFDFRDHERLPQGRNSLDLLILPLALSFSNVIRLCGFDGPAKADSVGLWPTSEQSEYANEKRKLRTDYPGFFTYWDSHSLSSQNLGANLRLQIEGLLLAGTDIKLMHGSTHEALRDLPTIEVH